MLLSAGVLSLTVPRAALADRWSIDAGVSSEVTRTTNADFGGTNSGADTIVDLRPHVRLHVDGARIKLSGAAAVSAIGYVDRTQPSRLEPDIDLVANVVAVERLVFVDASARAFQTSVNPFGARPDVGTTSENSLTTAVYRLAPRIEGTTPGGGIRYRAESDNSWTHEFGATTDVTGTGAAGYFGRHTLTVARDPHPLGWQLEGQHAETRYQDTSQSPLKIDLLRATVDYLFWEELTLGLRVGRENNNFAFAGEDTSGKVYGVQGRWVPSPRTDFNGYLEHRFFGSSWEIAFKHHTPHLAWNLTLSRLLESTPQSLLDLPPSENVVGLLDSLLTSRFPDPVERARVVNDLIARSGLPASTLQPIILRTERLSVVQLASASLTLLGVRNALTFTIYRTRTEDLASGAPLALNDPAANNSQQGAQVELNHRLTPTTDLTASADWSRITALDAVGDDRTIQRGVRLKVGRLVVPKTTVYAGARFRNLSSNTVPNAKEAAVFVGFDRRF